MQTQNEALSRPDALLRSLGDDPKLKAWAKQLQAQADAYIANKQPDPLDDIGLLVTHRR